MIESPRVTELLDQLQTLIFDAGIESGQIPSDMWLTRWLVVGVSVNPAHPMTSWCYFRLNPSGGMAPHEVVGLLDLSLDMVRDEMNEVELDEDEDEGV